MFTQDDRFDLRSAAHTVAIAQDDLLRASLFVRRRIFRGVESREIVGRHFSIFYPPADIAVDKPGQELEVAARDGRVEDEGWRVRKDGTWFWANVVITALRNSAGTLVGCGVVSANGLSNGCFSPLGSANTVYVKPSATRLSRESTRPSALITVRTRSPVVVFGSDV